MIAVRLAACATTAVVLTGCGGYVGPEPVDGARRPSPSASATLQIPPVQAMVNGTAPAAPAPTAAAPSKGSTGAVAPKCPTSSAVGFSAPAKIRTQVISFRVTLTQGATTSSAWTPDDPKDRHGLPLVAGVVFEGDDYWFFLGGAAERDVALRGAWKAKPRATMLVEGLAGDGRALYQQSRSFDFQQSTPDGGTCKPVLSYFTALTAEDQISRVR